MSEQRVCKGCGHAGEVRDTLCRASLRWVESLGREELCLHRCTFDEVGDAAHIFSALVPPDAVPQSEAQHEFALWRCVACGQSRVMPPESTTSDFLCRYCFSTHGIPSAAPIHQVPPAPKSPLGQIKLLHQALEGTDECVYCQKPQAAWLPMEECPARSGPNPSVRWGESEVAPPAPQFGSTKGKVEMAADFDEPEVLTVESALAELREMFPDPSDAFEISIREGFADRARVFFFKIDNTGTPWSFRQFYDSTLTEAMTRVREWKDKQNG